MHPFLKFFGNNGSVDQTLGADFIAGLTTAVLLVPQAMAYAQLAGLPPVVGLYASTLPLVVYAFIGTSRVMAVGPVALISLMTASALAPYGDLETSKLVVMGAALAVMVGLFQMALGLLKLEFLNRLLTRPVLTGFTSAAAILIGLSQLPELFGVDELMLFVDGWHLPTLIIGVAAIVVMAALRKIHRAIPSALLVIVIATVAVVVLNLDADGVSIVGEVPGGIPIPAVPIVEPAMVIDLIPSAIAIALVGYLESYAVARALARSTDGEISASREWTAVGAANVASGAVGGYPIAGGFSRSAVNHRAGAKTRLAGVITALLVGASLLALTPLFTYMPTAVLAAIILVAVSGLLHIDDWKKLARKGRRPLAVTAVTFGATLLFDIELGLVIGIAFGFAARKLFDDPDPGNVSDETKPRNKSETK